MNKTLAISAITLVAVVMGFSTIAPTLQQAFAHDVIKAVEIESGLCPKDFKLRNIPTGQHPDHNSNGLVCVNRICDGPPGIACAEPTFVFIDDNLKRNR